MKLISSKPTIDVCIATFKRPEGLRRLLESLIRQETRSEFCYRLIVVDNDARRSAEPVVGEFYSRGVPLIYDVEPRQNISLARNRTLSHATGEFIATIDDDEYADNRWLLNLAGGIAQRYIDRLERVKKRFALLKSRSLV